jgi:hypothetical protein
MTVSAALVYSHAELAVLGTSSSFVLLSPLPAWSYAVLMYNVPSGSGRKIES